MAEYIEKSEVERMLWAVIMSKEERTIEEMLEDAPTVNAIPISDMTNGEVIKALFPEYEFEKNKLHDERLTSSLGLDIMECLTEDIYVSKCWWNAPYEEEVEE